MKRIPAHHVPAIAAHIAVDPELRERLIDEAGSHGDLEHCEALRAIDPDACYLAAEGIAEAAHEGHEGAQAILADALDGYELAETVGERLAAIRMAANLTQRELAKRAGMLQPALARIERREDDPPALDALRRLREALGCSWDDLLG